MSVFILAFAFAHFYEMYSIAFHFSCKLCYSVISRGDSPKALLVLPGRLPPRWHEMNAHNSSHLLSHPGP